MADKKKEDLQIKRLIKRYLDHLEVEKNYSKYTIRNYKLYLRRFRNWFEDNYEQEYINRLSSEVVRKYRLFLSRFENDQGQRLSKKTQSYYTIALRAFLKYLTKQGVKTLAPEKIDLPKIEGRQIKFLNREQVERLLNQPSVSTEMGLRDKAILETLFSTGMRVSELAKLNIDDLDLKSREFGIRGKGRKVRVVFLSERAAKWLRRYLRARDDHYKPLWIRYSGKKPDPSTSGESMRLSVRSIQRMVEKYRKKANLPIKVSPHVIRHSFATNLLQNGADLRSVQEMLGHENVSTTQIYTNVAKARLQSLHQQHHPRG